MKWRWMPVLIVAGIVRCDDSAPFIETKPRLQDYVPSSAGLLSLVQQKEKKVAAQELDQALQRVNVRNSKQIKSQDSAKKMMLAPAEVVALRAVYHDDLLQQTKVTLSFGTVSLAQALKSISEITGLQFIVQQNIQGDVSHFSCKDVSLAVVLESLLSVSLPQAALVKDGSVWRIIPAREALAMVRHERIIERQKLVHAAAIRLYKASWTDQLKTNCLALWKQLGTADEGYCFIDDASRTVFVKGDEARVAEFKKCLMLLDVALPQVIIDARIIIANKDFEDALGFEWSGLYDRRASVKHMDFAGIGIGAVNSSDPASFNDLLSWSLNFIPTSLANAANKIGVPFVFGNRTMETKRLNLLLNAAESRSEIKTILQPHLRVTSGEKAEILVGQELPHQVKMQESLQGAVTTAQTTNYKDIGIKMHISPVVTPMLDEIDLDIYVENSGVAVPRGAIKTPSINSSRGDYEYTIETSRTKNKVQLKTGQTTQISGMVISVEEDFATGIPYLKDIPLFGVLFRGTRKARVDKQLIIYITPTVV